MMAAYLQGFIQTRRADYDRALQTELSSYNPQGIQRQILELQKMKSKILDGSVDNRSAQNLNILASRMAHRDRMSAEKNQRQSAKNLTSTIKTIQDNTRETSQDQQELVRGFRRELLQAMAKKNRLKTLGVPDADIEAGGTPERVLAVLEAHFSEKHRALLRDGKTRLTKDEYIRERLKKYAADTADVTDYFGKGDNRIDGIDNDEMLDFFVDSAMRGENKIRYSSDPGPDGEMNTEDDKRVPLENLVKGRAETLGKRRETEERKRAAGIGQSEFDFEGQRKKYLAALTTDSGKAADPEKSIGIIDAEIQRLEGMLSRGPDLTRFQSRTPFGALSNVNIRETGLSTGLGRFLQKPTNIIQTFNDNRAARREAQQAQQDFKFDIELLESIADQADDDNAIIDFEADRQQREQNARKAEETLAASQRTLAELEKRKKESGTSTNLNPLRTLATESVAAATESVASSLYPELDNESEADQFIDLAKPPSSSNSSSVLSPKEAQKITEELDKQESDFGGASREFNLRRKRLINLLSSEDPEVSKIVSRSLKKFVPGQTVSTANVLEKMKKNIIDTLSDKRKLKLATSTTLGATSTGEEKMTLSDPLAQILPGVELEPVNEAFQDLTNPGQIITTKKVYTTSPMDILELIEKDLREAGKDVPR
tara:strand:- start:34 stop:2007 length:1974 start_codon:yes stop_codon:yes gene_type:complete